MCRKIWEEEKFPQMWKKSIIIQLHKKKDTMNCDNYRGVSLLPHCEKVMASVILQRIRLKNGRDIERGTSRSRAQHHRSAVYFTASDRNVY